MDEETLESYKKAGKIAAEALVYGKEMIKPGAKMVEVCDAVEDKIVSLGGGIAFPAQISCNEIVAHYCPTEECDIVFEDQVACLDVGVHVGGYIGDNAVTVDLSGKYSELVKASREALNAALKIIAPGVTLSEIGKTVQEVISSYDFAPVRNLSGHGLGKFDVHTKPSIPNFDTGDDTALVEGTVIAIEPFASAGQGVVSEGSSNSLFMLTADRSVRNTFTRQVLKEIQGYNGLPFTTRWLTRKFGAAKTRFALKELNNNNMLREFPPLVDTGLVSQAENTVYVCEKPVVLTKF